MRKSLIGTILMLGIVILSQSLSPIALTPSVLGSDGTGDETPPLGPVHKEKTVSGTVPARFGRVAMYEFDDREEPERSKLVSEYIRAKKERFPETQRWVNAGCSPSFWKGEKSVTLYYCETCRRLEDEWFARHPDFLKEDRLP